MLAKNIYLILYFFIFLALGRLKVMWSPFRPNFIYAYHVILMSAHI